MRTHTCISHTHAFYMYPTCTVKLLNKLFFFLSNWCPCHPVKGSPNFMHSTGCGYKSRSNLFTSKMSGSRSRVVQVLRSVAGTKSVSQSISNAARFTINLCPHAAANVQLTHKLMEVTESCTPEVNPVTNTTCPCTTHPPICLQPQ